MRTRIAVLVGVALLGCASAHDGESDADFDAGRAVDGSSVDALAFPPDAGSDAWVYDPGDIVALETAWRASCARRLRCIAGGSRCCPLDR